MLAQELNSQAIFQIPTVLAPLAVLTAAFMGSLHCVGMCGPLILSTSRSHRDLMLYQLGRLIGYTSLGVISGAIGSKIFSTTALTSLQFLTSLLLGLFFLWMGFRLLSKQSIHFNLPNFFSSSLFACIHKFSGKYSAPFLIGLFTPFLPCGWLYGFVLAAVATHTVYAGAAFMFLFWLGTLPMLISSPMVARKWLGPLTKKFPRISGVLLCLAGLLVVAGRATAYLSTQISQQSLQPEISCPLHSHPLLGKIQKL